MGREFLIGDGYWGFDAYCQAATEGMIDPKQVSFKLFSKMSELERIEPSSETGEYSEEVRRSIKNVVDLFRVGRQRVIQEWFGKDYLLNHK